MGTTNTSNPPRPIWGILSLVLAALGLLVSLYFLLFGGILQPLWFFWLEIALFLVLFLLGFMSGLIGVIRQELPKWLSYSGTILTLLLTAIAILFLNWLLG